METSATWYLRKHEDGGTFGPLPFDQLVRWAELARVAPHDLISSDEGTWIKAPMLPDLGMDWLVEVTSERLYGPTTLGAIHEFVRLGEITFDHFVINACDGSRRRIHEIEALLREPKTEDANGFSQATPAAEGISINIEERIRDLERSLREERRALREIETRYHELEQRYREVLAATPSE